MKADTRGLDFTRYIIAKAIGGDTPREQQRFAEARWGLSSRPAMHLKATIGVASTSDGTWAAPLADLAAAGTEFFALAREASIIGKMEGLRRLPFEKRLLRQVGGATASWVGEGKVKPCTSGGFSSETLPPRKLVGQTVQTAELLKLSDPDAEMIIRDDLVTAISEALDTTFMDPVNAGSTGVVPASITYGAASVAASGDRDGDLRSLVNNFDGALDRAVFIANPLTLIKFSGADRPAVGARGGQMLGVPVIASRKVTADILALVDAGDVGLAAGDTRVNVSREGTVEMQTAPDSPVSASTVLVPLWQNNLVGIQVEQFLNWSAGSNAVSVLTGMSGDSP
jgi:HK97 family phage major capsid protein